MPTDVITTRLRRIDAHYCESCGKRNRLLIRRCRKCKRVVRFGMVAFRCKHETLLLDSSRLVRLSP